MGGTFDPVHLAHLRLAEEAAGHLALERVRWIPSGHPGHRAAPGTRAAHRLEMVRLAVRDNPRFTVDDAEATARGAAVHDRHAAAACVRSSGAEVPLVLIIGADQLHKLDTWRDWRELLDRAHFAVGERPGYALAPDSLPAAVAAEWRRARGRRRDACVLRPPAAMVAFPMTPLGISASDIRRRLHGGGERALLATAGSSRLYSCAPALLGGRKNRLMDIRKKQKAVDRGARGRQGARHRGVRRHPPLQPVRPRHHRHRRLGAPDQGAREPRAGAS